jgi:hypothetical protein
MKMMDSPNSLVMRFIILSWMEDKYFSKVLIGYKDFHPNHHWKMKFVIGRKDFVMTLALGLRPKQGYGKVRAKNATRECGKVREWAHTFPNGLTHILPSGFTNTLPNGLPFWELESPWTPKSSKNNWKGQSWFDW